MARKLRPETTTTSLGGEVHQQATGAADRITTNHGVPVSDDQNSLKGGMRGPTLLEDFVLREKIQHFDHERIPERIVHARGSGAHGFFELTESLAAFTSAKTLTEVGEKTEMFVRFSTVAGGAGSVDIPRDVRGFSAAIDVVQNAFVHLKAIGHTAEGDALLDRAGVAADPGVVNLGEGVDGFLAPARTRQWAREPSVRMLA